jgi:regulator of cell morphogenesis and NO signaling
MYKNIFVHYINPNDTGMIDFDCAISDIVKLDYRTADVFIKYHLSYCCSGAISLKSACELKGIEIEQISNDLKEATRNLVLPNNLPYKEWKIDFLIDFITNIHHAYIYQTIPPLCSTLESFAKGHRTKYPELTRILELFTKLAEILLLHNRHEDEIIFPYIKQIDSAYQRKEPYGNLFVRTLRKPLHIIEKEHSQINGLLKDIKIETRRFTVPDKACLSYQVIIKKLEEAHINLLQHKFLENAILFPRAIAIEQKLLQL